MFTVRHRLFRISLASALLRIRLRLSWLSFSPSSDLPMIAEVVSPGAACCQTITPHASRVERTRLETNQARTPRTGLFHFATPTIGVWKAIPAPSAFWNRKAKSPALPAAMAATEKDRRSDHFTDTALS
jgi:hypothetical protein